jgi:hypothetical protein
MYEYFATSHKSHFVIRSHAAQLLPTFQEVAEVAQAGWHARFSPLPPMQRRSNRPAFPPSVMAPFQLFGPGHGRGTPFQLFCLRLGDLSMTDNALNNETTKTVLQKCTNYPSSCWLWLIWSLSEGLRLLSAIFAYHVDLALINDHIFQQTPVCSGPYSNTRMKLGKVALLALSRTAILINGLTVGTSLPEPDGGAVHPNDSKVAGPDHNGDSLNYGRSFEVRACYDSSLCITVKFHYTAANNLHASRSMTTALSTSTRLTRF